MTRPALAALLAAMARAPAASATAPPESATVFVRVIGEVRAEYQRGWKQVSERTDVEIGTGSGFLISPFGHVLTNRHVVGPEELTLNRGGTPVQVRLEVKRIETVLPDGRSFEAALDASDADLDLAVLSVTGEDLPFIPLGDSDALKRGQPVRVLGFPFGRDVEVGREGAPDAPAQATISRGVVAALRASQEGEPRFIQTDATVNPGSSGGPMVDEDGFAVGVIRMRLTRGPGVGFAIPINRVKDFLEANGLERVFPGRRLRLGVPLAFEGKGLRLRLPEGLEDTAPSRLRLQAADPASELALHVDRVATLRSLSDLESLVLSGRGSEAFVASGAPLGKVTRMGGRPALAGVAAGSRSAGGHADDSHMEYTILDLGKEKVLARWVGPAVSAAFNRSILQGSLASLEADPLLTAEVAAPVPTALEPAPLPAPDAPPLALPVGWVQEATGPHSCPHLPPPDSILSASPLGDFTVFLRTAWWRAPGFTAEEALAACAGRMQPPEPRSYSLRRDRLGMVETLRGTFAGRGPDVIQLELVSPPSKLGFVDGLFRTWIRAFAP